MIDVAQDVSNIIGVTGRDKGVRDDIWYGLCIGGIEGDRSGSSRRVAGRLSESVSLSSLRNDKLGPQSGRFFESPMRD
jgi:hypothetical protein